MTNLWWQKFCTDLGMYRRRRGRGGGAWERQVASTLHCHSNRDNQQHSAVLCRCNHQLHTLCSWLTRTPRTVASPEFSAKTAAYSVHERCSQQHLYTYTVSGQKWCHFDYNSRISWSIFIFFAPLKFWWYDKFSFFFTSTWWYPGNVYNTNFADFYEIYGHNKALMIVSLCQLSL